MWEVLCLLVSTAIAELWEQRKYSERPWSDSMNNPGLGQPHHRSDSWSPLLDPIFSRLSKFRPSNPAKQLLDEEDQVRPGYLRRVWNYVIPEHFRKNVSTRSYVFVLLWVVSIILADRAINFPTGLTSYILATTTMLCLWDSSARAFVRYGGECFAYLALFDQAQYLPLKLRPPISNNLMEDWDRFLIGATAPEVFAVDITTSKDLLAAVAYGILHYIAPFIAMFFLAHRSVRALQVFARSFGRMNFICVLVQILFPNVPPWFKPHYGAAAEPQYGMRGFPGGLVRIDRLLNTLWFEKEFYEEPLPFASWPSLHACWPLFIGLFVGTVSWPFLVVGLLHWALVSWSVMYLEHHWFFDVLSGSALAAAAYQFARLDLVRALAKTSREQLRASLLQSAHVQNGHGSHTSQGQPNQSAPTFTGWGADVTAGRDWPAKQEAGSGSRPPGVLNDRNRDHDGVPTSHVVTTQTYGPLASSPSAVPPDDDAPFSLYAHRSNSTPSPFTSANGSKNQNTQNTQNTQNSPNKPPGSSPTAAEASPTQQRSPMSRRRVLSPFHKGKRGEDAAMELLDLSPRSTSLTGPRPSQRQSPAPPLPLYGSLDHRLGGASSQHGPLQASVELESVDAALLAV